MPNQLPDFHEVDTVRDQVRASAVLQAVWVRLLRCNASGQGDIAEEPIELRRAQARALLGEEQESRAMLDARGISVSARIVATLRQFNTVLPR